MDLTTYQLWERRNAADQITRPGAFGKNTALTNGQNTGILDYIANDLDVLYNEQQNFVGLVWHASAAYSAGTVIIVGGGKVAKCTTAGTSGTTAPTWAVGNVTDGTVVWAVSDVTAITAHINNTNNPHSVTKQQVGLGNCDNTSDLNKPISTATQTALDGKVDNDTFSDISSAYWLIETDLKFTDNPNVLLEGDIQIYSNTPTRFLTQMWIFDNYYYRFCRSTLWIGVAKRNITVFNNNGYVAFLMPRIGWREYLRANVRCFETNYSWKNCITEITAIASAPSMTNPYVLPSQAVLTGVGTVIYTASNSVPDGYLLCNGSAVSRTTYSDLFTAIDTTYGAGDGSTTFNVPNISNLQTNIKAVIKY